MNHYLASIEAHLKHSALSPELPLFSRDTIRSIEANHPQLMDKAGVSIAQWLIRLCPLTPSQSPPTLLALVGTGNNGGDVLAALPSLTEEGYRPYLWMALSPSALRDDAAQHWPQVASLIADKKVQIIHTEALGALLVQEDKANPNDWVIDGLWGLGYEITRPSSAENEKSERTIRTVISAINQRSAHWRVLSVDLPSGLCAESGWVRTEYPEEARVVRADVTLALLTNKAGYWMSYGGSACGTLIFDDLGVRPSINQNHTALRININHAHDESCKWPQRPSHTHKGLCGDVVFIGGHSPMLGAGLLACESALAMGAGRVFWWQVNEATSHASVSARPEIIHGLPTANHGTNTVWLIGPGLGRDEAIQQTLMAWLWPLIRDHAQKNAPMKIVWDADGFWVLQKLLIDNAQTINLQTHFLGTVITPHPLEAARLLNWENGHAVQTQRIVAAEELAQKLGMTVVLKGAGTLIAEPHLPATIPTNRLRPNLWLNPENEPALATAGSGDVLAGAIASLIAQGMAPTNACRAAVAWHAVAGKTLAQLNGRLMARELIPAMRSIAHNYSTACDSPAKKNCQ